MLLPDLATPACSSTVSMVLVSLPISSSLPSPIANLWASPISWIVQVSLLPALLPLTPVGSHCWLELASAVGLVGLSLLSAETDGVPLRLASNATYYLSPSSLFIFWATQQSSFILFYSCCPGSKFPQSSETAPLFFLKLHTLWRVLHDLGIYMHRPKGPTVGSQDLWFWIRGKKLHLWF